jgi:hypothetical protein
MSCLGRTFSLRRKNLASNTCSFESNKTSLLAWGFRIRKEDLMRAGFESLLLEEGAKSAYVTLHLTCGASGNEEKSGGESRQASTKETWD